jgi:hypothetical protein
MYICSFYFSRVKLNKIILNKIFDFETEKPKNLKTVKSQIPNMENLTKKTIIDSSNNIFTHKKINLENNSSKSLSIKAFVPKIPKKLKLSFCEILRKPFCQCFANKFTKNKFYLYDQANKVLENCLDISHIIHILEEHDKLKLALLNDQQLALFQFISKDVYFVEEIVKEQSHLRQLKLLLGDKEKLCKLIKEFKIKIENNKRD